MSCHNVRDRNITIHGHRGCRGLWPENSLKAFEEALKMGVTTLELDVVLTEDDQVIISHDQIMDFDICDWPDGNSISGSEQMSLNIFQMTAEEAQQFWIGRNPHPQFPQQQQFPSHKPLLDEAISLMALYAQDVLKMQQPITWNIEIKSTPQGDGLYHPTPKLYVQKFLQSVGMHLQSNQCIIQSFDSRILEELHMAAPALRLVYLNEDMADMAAKLSTLTFKPYGYSPNYRLVNQMMVDYCAEQELELIVWTVNEEKDMLSMMDLGVRQIITDYPDRLLKLINE
ncbi:MAG: glycerophosphodiester phosphodiesterase family protein [Flavobacteriales bacterium]